MPQSNHAFRILGLPLLFTLAIGCARSGNTIDLKPDPKSSSLNAETYHPIQIGGSNSGPNSGQATLPQPPAPVATPPSAPLISPEPPPSSPDPAQAPTPSTLETTVHFDFASAEVRPQDRTQLDAFIQSLPDASRIITIRVVGMSDSLGNTANNARLALQRAETVRQYLLTRSNELLPAPIPEATIVIDTAMPHDTSCDQESSRTEKIRCLQADRRSDVTVIVGIVHHLND